MASTEFTDNSTVILAAWLNDIDVVGYGHLTSPAGTNTITATGPVAMAAGKAAVKAAIKGFNAPAGVLRLDAGVAGHRRWNINTGN